MKKVVFFAAFLISAVGFAHGTFKVSCQVQEALNEPSQIFEGTLSAQAKSPVVLTSSNKSKIQVSANYHDSAAAGPFDLISFNITKAGKTQTLGTAVLGSIGLVSMTETISGQNPSLIGCQFQQNQ